MSPSDREWVGKIGHTTLLGSSAMNTTYFYQYIALIYFKNDLPNPFRQIAYFEVDENDINVFSLYVSTWITPYLMN